MIGATGAKPLKKITAKELKCIITTLKIQQGQRVRNFDLKEVVDEPATLALSFFGETVDHPLAVYRVSQDTLKELSASIQAKL